MEENRGVMCNFCGQVPYNGVPHATCADCGGACCRNCQLKMPCCGRTLCFFDDGKNRGPSTEKCCFAKHKTSRTLPCGHLGCNFQTTCNDCHLGFPIDIPPKTTNTKKPVTTGTKSSSISKQASTTAKKPSSPRKRPSSSSTRKTASSTKKQKSPPGKKGSPTSNAPSKKGSPTSYATTKKVPPLSYVPKKVKSQGAGDHFPTAVYNLVKVTSQTDPDVIDWVVDGEAFYVQHKSPKLGKILGKHFSHKKYSSFQRQLNMYGFKKHIKGKYAGFFQHPSFHRDRPGLLPLIQRNSRPKPTKPAYYEKPLGYPRPTRSGRMPKTNHLSPSLELSSSDDESINPENRVPNPSTGWPRPLSRRLANRLPRVTLSPVTGKPEPTVSPNSRENVEPPKLMTKTVVINEISNQLAALEGRRPTMQWRKRVDVVSSPSVVSAAAPMPDMAPTGPAAPNTAPVAITVPGGPATAPVAIMTTAASTAAPLAITAPAGPSTAPAAITAPAATTTTPELVAITAPARPLTAPVATSDSAGPTTTPVSIMAPGGPSTASVAITAPAAAVPAGP